MICSSCSSSEFRLSKFRLKDIEHLTRLQYPVRCLNCRQRAYGGLTLALFLFQSRKAHRHNKPRATTE